ncbi:MAG TPA: hypothetical protein VHB21_07340 [Minicystis sp.]|nr:hypothetical protein [Minicystis sp.]
METNEGSDAAGAAKADDAGTGSEHGSPAEPEKAVEATDAAPPEKPAEPAGAAAGDEAKASATPEAAEKPSAQQMPAFPERPAKKSSSAAGYVALGILLAGVLGMILVLRRTDAPRGQQEHRRGRQGQGHGRVDATPWKVGTKVPVVVTVLPDDTDNLECISKQELNGKHCAYEAKGTAWSKGDSDDKTLLRPYATTGRRRLVASGFWSQIPKPLPEKRFLARCTFDIQGKISELSVHFKKAADFHDVKDWFAGELTDCTVITPGQHGAKGKASAAASAKAAPPAEPKKE